MCYHKIGGMCALSYAVHSSAAIPQSKPSVLTAPFAQGSLLEAYISGVCERDGKPVPYGVKRRFGISKKQWDAGWYLYRRTPRLSS